MGWIGRAACWGLTLTAFAAGPAAAQFGHRGGGGGSHGRKAAGPVVDSAAVPRPERKTGCTVLDVRITAGTLVTVARAAGDPCGPIEPTLIGLPALDSAHHTLTMSIALVNGGLDRLHAPVDLEAGQSALIVTAGAPPPARDSAPKPAARPVAPTPPPAPSASASAAAPPAAGPPAAALPVDSAPAAPSGPPGTVVLVGGATPLSARTDATAPVTTVTTAAGPRRVEAVHFVGADPAPVDSTPGVFTPVRWSFDKLLTPPGHDPLIADDGTTVLAPGDTSAPRRITIVVPAGVTGFRVRLEGSGLYVFTVPLRAPDTVPRDELEDSRAADNILTNAPGFPGHVVRNKLWLAFRTDATADQRQAAIDAVEGEVIGGMLRGQERYYYVRFTANPDSGAAPLAHALRTLAPLPGVQDVMPDRGD